jgi:salicylate hydroxylase
MPVLKSDTPNSDKPVLIVGAGIGGLTLAHALLARGVAVQILEAAPELTAVGAGIQIPPNAVKVLRALKLDTAVSERAFKPTAIEARMGETGREIFNIPLAAQSITRWGAPYLHIHRADYISALAEALPKNVLSLGVRVKAYDQDASIVRVTLDNGKIVEGKYLIGADGIRSTVRTQMLGPDAPRFTGNVAWRVVVPTAALGDHAPRPTACAWFGRGKHGVTYRLGGQGQMTNFVGVVEREDWQEEGWSIKGSKADALADFSGWHPTITTLIETADTFHRWALFDRAPLSQWTDGRVTLMGDAAHPMLPFLAQGAAMAVEDAYILAQTIAAGAPLTDYQNKRLDRTTKVQAASRANMGLFHKRSRATQFVTYGPMWIAGKILPNIVHRRMDWLYGYDVTT